MQSPLIQYVNNRAILKYRSIERVTDVKNWMDIYSFDSPQAFLNTSGINTDPVISIPAAIRQQYAGSLECKFFGQMWQYISYAGNTSYLPTKLELIQINDVGPGTTGVLIDGIPYSGAIAPQDSIPFTELPSVIDFSLIWARFNANIDWDPSAWVNPVDQWFGQIWCNITVICDQKHGTN